MTKTAEQIRADFQSKMDALFQTAQRAISMAEARETRKPFDVDAVKPLGRYVAAGRALLDITQKELGAATGIKTPAIAHLEAPQPTSRIDADNMMPKILAYFQASGLYADGEILSFDKRAA
jgi:hypothetical protein